MWISTEGPLPLENVVWEFGRTKNRGAGRGYEQALQPTETKQDRPRNRLLLLLQCCFACSRRNPYEALLLLQSGRFIHQLPPKLIHLSFCRNVWLIIIIRSPKRCSSVSSQMLSRTNFQRGYRLFTPPIYNKSAPISSSGQIRLLLYRT